MATITSLSDFQQANELNIPLSVSSPVANASLQTPDSVAFLNNLIIDVEREVLLNAFGVEKYNEIKLAVDNPPLTGDIEKLINGETIDDKIWYGLKKLLPYKVFEVYMSPENQSFLVGTGNVQLNPEKSGLITGAYKVANASQKFVKLYQGKFYNEPDLTNGFVDWFVSTNNVEFSLYEYMVKKEYDLQYFKVYQPINSFGL